MKYFDVAQTQKLMKTAKADGVEVFVGQHEEDCEIRGTKAGLKFGRPKLTELEFHQDYGHLGSCPGCSICKLVKGASRRIYRKVDPHKEERSGHTCNMDTVT